LHRQPQLLPALQIVFPPATGHYVRLRALSELNGNPWTSAAEINVLGALASGQSAALASVSLNPTTVVGGGSSTGTVTLSAPAPAGGAVVSLSSGKRELLDRIGFLDERFNGYGSDDMDFCLRAEMAGYKLAVTRLVTVRHEHGRGGPTTFLKSIGREAFAQQQTEAAQKLRDKWGADWETMSSCLESGDYSKLLQRPAEAEPDFVTTLDGGTSATPPNQQ
jgi:hypothetical protein